LLVLWNPIADKFDRRSHSRFTPYRLLTLPKRMHCWKCIFFRKVHLLSFLKIYSLLGFYWNWRAYDFFPEGHPRRWEVTLTHIHKKGTIKNKCGCTINNSWSADIVRPNFEHVRPISHYDWHDVRTFHQHFWLLALKLVYPQNLVRYIVKELEVVTTTVANAANISSLATKSSGLVNIRKYICIHRLR